MSTVTVNVLRDKYLEVLGFTTYAYFKGYITSYSGLIGGKRALGEYIENFIYGKIAEVAFQEFLGRHHGMRTYTDLDLCDFIIGDYLPDIVLMRDSAGKLVTMEFWIDVKEVRRDQKWLLIPASSVNSRPYDAYVAVRVGLPDDHLAWIIGQLNYVQTRMSRNWRQRWTQLNNIIQNIPCVVEGYVLWDDVYNVLLAHQGSASAKNQLDAKFGPGNWGYFPEGSTPPGTSVRLRRDNIGFELSSLAGPSNWRLFVGYISANRRLVPRVPLSGGGRKPKMPSACKNKFGSLPDFRDMSFKCLSMQLQQLATAHGGSPLCSTSWFSR